MEKHTPLPWILKDGEYLMDANRKVVATFEPAAFPQDSANAAFICKAVNCHEELLELLKERFAGIQSEADWHGRAQQAIARAEGKE